MYLLSDSYQFIRSAFGKLSWNSCSNFSLTASLGSLTAGKNPGTAGGGFAEGFFYFFYKKEKKSRKSLPKKFFLFFFFFVEVFIPPIFKNFALFLYTVL